MSVKDHAIDGGGWCLTCRCSAYVCMKAEADKSEALNAEAAAKIEALTNVEEGAVLEISRIVEEAGGHCDGDDHPRDTINGVSSLIECLKDEKAEAVAKYHAEIKRGRIACEGIVKIAEAEAAARAVAPWREAAEKARELFAAVHAMADGTEEDADHDGETVIAKVDQAYLARVHDALDECEIKESNIFAALLSSAPKSERNLVCEKHNWGNHGNGRHCPTCLNATPPAPTEKKPRCGSESFFKGYRVCHLPDGHQGKHKYVSLAPTEKKPCSHSNQQAGQNACPDCGAFES